MRNIKMSLQFDGTRYSGWQRLKDNDSTIQGKLEDLLSKMTDEKINVIGCSRTDKGVHAKSLICNFFTKSEMETEKMMSTEVLAGTSAYCNEPNRPEEGQGQREQAGLKKACADFESIFIGYML